MKISTILLFVFSSALCLATEDQSVMKIGLFTDFNINSHSADFNRVPDCPNCSPGFRDGSGSGISIGGLFEYPIYKDLLTFGLRATYYGFSADLEAKEKTTIIVENAPVAGEFTHSFSADLTAIGFEPNLRINPIIGFPDLYFTLGLFISPIILTKDYSQKEEITKPSDAGTFLNPDGSDSFSRIRNKFSGELEKASSIMFSTYIGVSYQLPLNKNRSLIAEPELSYMLGNTNIVDDPYVRNWKANSLRIGLALKYAFLPEKEIIKQYEKIERIDTIRVEQENIETIAYSIGIPKSTKSVTLSDGIELTTETISRTDTAKIPVVYKVYADVKAFGIGADGKASNSPVFQVEEFVSSRLDPLLNYIFFDENSDKIPSKYKLLSKDDTDNFKVDSLYKSSTLDIYYNFLNIIGSRMLQYPKSKIVLNGYNSDLNTEKANKNLSAKRAEAVRDYLKDVWGIANNRMKIEAGNLPANPSTPSDDVQKMEENRRVEINSDDYRLLEPVFIQNTSSYANPLGAIFKIDAKADRGFTKWELIANQKIGGENKTYTKTGEGAPPSELTWLIDEESQSIAQLADPIQFKLKVIDAKGKAYETSEQKIEIKVVSIDEKKANASDDYRIDKFSLILFDFDKSDIAGNNRKIIDLIKDRIEPESIIEIKGYTDITGEEEYNLKLSQRRSEQAKAALGRKDAQSVGIGEQILLFDNDLPEGRFYCRTVDIIVKTKIKK